MFVRRFLVTAALLGVVAATAGAAGCSALPARWSDPEPQPTTAEPAGEGRVGDAGDTADQPPPKRTNTLEAGAKTLYFLEGELPAGGADGTTASLGGSLVLRGQCHNGTLRVLVTNGVSGEDEARIGCDGKAHERPLGKVKIGDTVSVELKGKSGTDFAIDLVAR